MAVCEGLAAASVGGTVARGGSPCGRASPLGSTSLGRRTTSSSFSLAFPFAAPDSSPVCGGGCSLDAVVSSALGGGRASSGDGSRGAALRPGGELTPGNDCTSVLVGFAKCAGTSTPRGGG